MYEDVVFTEGPIETDAPLVGFDVARVKARVLGRPYNWDNYETDTTGVVLVYEGEDGAIHIQQIQWLLYHDPTGRNHPHTRYFYNRFNSLAEARASGLGWAVEWALGG